VDADALEAAKAGVRVSKSFRRPESSLLELLQTEGACEQCGKGCEEKADETLKRGVQSSEALPGAHRGTGPRQGSGGSG
jgi:hypothetical protein